MFSKSVAFLILFMATLGIFAQQEEIAYTIGEKYNDRHKYSNLLSIADDGNGGTVIVRSYYSGIVLRPKGYLVEHYNKDLELLSEYNYKLKN